MTQTNIIYIQNKNTSVSTEWNLARSPSRDWNTMLGLCLSKGCKRWAEDHPQQLVLLLVFLPDSLSGVTTPAKLVVLVIKDVWGNGAFFFFLLHCEKRCFPFSARRNKLGDKCYVGLLKAASITNVFDQKSNLWKTFTSAYQVGVAASLFHPSVSKNEQTSRS